VRLIRRIAIDEAGYPLMLEFAALDRLAAIQKPTETLAAILSLAAEG
jgi:hypothetical protein